MPSPLAAIPKLARVERVELVRTGTWRLATGEQQFTAADLASAIAALDCPAVKRPHIKIGHTDPRWDGEPALGWVTSLSLTNEGNTLVGDLVGMPAWLGEVAASAFPQRSVEGIRAMRCQIGHVHPLVITAVSLLGVTPPGVGTLSSLQDHPSLTAYTQAMYGLAASQAPEPGGEPVTITFPREAPVPDPQPIAATVDLDDLRDAFYDGAPPNLWITQVQLAPTQLIVTSGGDDDATYRIPYTINADESISFGTPVPVEVTYVDAPVDPGEIGPVGVAASAPKTRAVFARTDRSQPLAAAGEDGDPAPGPVIPQTDPMQDVPPVPPAPSGPATPTVPNPAPATEPPEPQAPAKPAAEPEHTNEPEGGTDVSLSEFRSRLGLPDDADEAAVLAAVDELKTKATTPAEPPAELVAAAAKAGQQEEQFAAALGRIDALSAELAAIKAEKAQQAKDAFFGAAIQQGKITPAERPTWEADYDKSPEVVTRIIGATRPGTAVPVAAAGYTGDPEPQISDDDLMSLFPPEMRETAGKVA
jgi:hypothetical protein